MMQTLRANTERAQRSVARAVVAGVRPTGLAGLGTDMAAFATTTEWNMKPSVPSIAICTFGKYHTRRLQEMHT